MSGLQWYMQPCFPIYLPGSLSQPNRKVDLPPWPIHPYDLINTMLFCIGASLDPHLQRNPTPESPATSGTLDRITTSVLPRLSRIPVDSKGNYIKEARQDDTYPYLAFALDDFDDESARQLLLREDSDEFAVVMHVRFSWVHGHMPSSLCEAYRSSTAHYCSSGVQLLGVGNVFVGCLGMATGTTVLQ